MVFEKKTIEGWFERCGHVCPITSTPLKPNDLFFDEAHHILGDKIRVKILKECILDQFVEKTVSLHAHSNKKRHRARNCA